MPFADLAFACILQVLGGGRVEAKCETPYLREIAGAVKGAAQVFDVDPEIITAVIRHESSFRQYIVSSHHALGLMQPMRNGAIQGDWRKLSDHDLSDITLNIWLGTAYLSKWSHRCKRPILYLTPYNGGSCVPSDYSRAVLKDLHAAKMAFAIDRSPHGLHQAVRKPDSHHRLVQTESLRPASERRRESAWPGTRRSRPPRAPRRGLDDEPRGL